jgi:hypothetical protein
MIRSKTLARRFFSVVVASFIGLALFMVSPSKVNATDLPVVSKSGTLNSNETWTAGNVYMINSGVNIQDGVVLTIEAGAIVKSSSPWSSSIMVYDGGTLNVSGTTSQPVVFTSSQDDSAGGDSNANGPSTGMDGNYGTALQPLSNSAVSINVSHATFRYGTQALTCYQTTGTISLEDNTFYNGMQLVDCDGITAKRNVYEVAGMKALQLQSIDMSEIALSGDDRNSFTGSGIGRVVELTNINVQSSNSWAISGSTGAIYRTNGVSVYGNFSISDGAVVKVANNASYAFHVSVGGNLYVEGDSTSPAIFTTESDDSIGGDTNNNGASLGSQTSYNIAIRVDQGTVSISHARFYYGQQALAQICSGTAYIDINYSQLNGGGIVANGCYGSGLQLQANQFNVSSGLAIQISNEDLTGIALSGSASNSFAGSGKSRNIEYSGGTAVPAGSTWNVSGSSGAVLTLHNNLIVDGVLNAVDSPIMKFGSTGHLKVSSGGTLNIEGIAGTPAALTSVKDDSIGGDTNNNGNSSGSSGDFASAIVWNTDSTVNLSHATIKYANQSLVGFGGNATITNTSISNASLGLFTAGNAKVNASGMTMSSLSTGINATQMSQVTYRGSFSNISGKSVYACNWNQGCMVDAAYVDWGNASGPVSGNLACGGVTVDPWLYGSTSSESGMTKNCNGAYTPAEQLSTNAAGFQNAMSSKQIQCSGGFQDACDAIDNAIACLSGAMSVAQSTAPWPLPPTGTAEQVNAAGGLILSGASDYLSAQAMTTVTGFNFSLLTQALSVAGTIATMTNAYNNCAP